MMAPENEAVSVDSLPGEGRAWRNISVARFGQTFEEVAIPAFAKDERWRSVERMISDPSGPARAGTRTHEVLRFTGSTYVTGVEPEGSRFVEGLEIQLSGPMWLLEPLLARLYARRTRSELHALKTLLEKQSPLSEIRRRSKTVTTTVVWPTVSLYSVGVGHVIDLSEVVPARPGLIPSTQPPRPRCLPPAPRRGP
jgi:hypothetical protein